MSQLNKMMQKKPESDDPGHQISRNYSKTSTKQFHSGRQNRLPTSGTPFQPPVTAHLEILSNDRPITEKIRVMSYLQQSYGNKYVQSLINSIKMQTVAKATKTEIRRQPDEEEEIKTPSQQEEELQTSPLVAVVTQVPPPPSTNNIAGKKHTNPKNIDSKHQPLIPMVPVPPSAGGCVIVRGGAFDIFLNPAEPACIVGGEARHEAKHIMDFVADPYYSTIPSSGTVPDGETFYYRNNADARRFEHPACDVEMAWLREQLAGNPSPENRAIMENRLNVTLPNYRASFG